MKNLYLLSCILLIGCSYDSETSFPTENDKRSSVKDDTVDRTNSKEKEDPTTDEYDKEENKDCFEFSGNYIGCFASGIKCFGPANQVDIRKLVIECPPEYIPPFDKGNIPDPPPDF